jgi:dolichyl-phosphate-mannose-protein mannosyltransferase
MVQILLLTLSFSTIALALSSRDTGKRRTMQIIAHLARWLSSLNKHALVVFAMGIALLSPGLGVPKGSALDEFHYVSGAKALFHKSPGLWHGVPDTNPEHPPLGKYLIGLGIEFIGDNSVGWRVASVLFGAVTLTVIFVWMSDIADPFTAWVAVLLVISNGFWFVMSRVAMLSIFELCFCVTGFYFLSKDKPVLSGLFLGLASACRWNAVFGIALIVAWLVLRKKPELKKAALIGLTSLASYTIAFLPALRFSVREFVRAQLFIFRYHVHFVGNAKLAQKWYFWPFRSEPELCLNFLLGNRVTILLGVVAIIFLLARSSYRLLALAPIVFWLQWAVTGRTFQYYYYFLDSIVFLSIAVALMLGQIRTKVKWCPAACVSVSLLWFILHYPYFTYWSTPWDPVLNRICLTITFLVR